MIDELKKVMPVLRERASIIDAAKYLTDDDLIATAVETYEQIGEEKNKFWPVYEDRVFIKGVTKIKNN